MSIERTDQDTAAKSDEDERENARPDPLEPAVEQDEPDKDQGDKLARREDPA